MELKSVQRARSIWLLDLDDLNPRGKAVGPDLIEWLKDAYQFSKVPKDTNDLDDTKAMFFSGGQFQVREEIFIGVELRIYNDGLVADTRESTESSDLFLSDVFESAAKVFSLVYKPETIRRKLYVSELIVSTNKQIGVLSPKLEKFAERLTEATGDKLPIQVSGISFWSETNPPTLHFRFERKWGADFSENRYYSRAPLPTAKHQEMLNELENILS
jgi:hypothetical protein